MADNSANIYPYPLQFDPSQWANKYSQYAGKPIPWPSQYSGTPTDAYGNPIQSYLAAQSNAAAQPAAMPPSTTLNTNPQQYSPADYIAKGAGLLDPGQGPTLSATDAQGPNGLSSWAMSQFPTSSQQLVQSMAGGGQSGAPAAPAQPAAPTNPVDMNAAYLAALANPGKITTPGATVAQAPTPTGQSNVLQQFLANWQNKGSPTTGAGNYNNLGFFNALQGNV